MGKPSRDLKQLDATDREFHGEYRLIFQGVKRMQEELEKVTSLQKENLKPFLESLVNLKYQALRIKKKSKDSYRGKPLHTTLVEHCDLMIQTIEGIQKNLQGTPVVFSSHLELRKYVNARVTQYAARILEDLRKDVQLYQAVSKQLEENAA
ncbi:hypothetical protein HZB02_03115 [Candidatus Woesearchaeota archaeon]|nr:hypothetical protein [Candidatus Woesearchaeota archaeon]